MKNWKYHSWTIICLCLLLFTLNVTASHKIVYDTNYVFVGVYSAGNTALSVWRTDQINNKDAAIFEARFLSDDSTAYRFKIPKAYRLWRVLGAKNRAILIFEGIANNMVISISKGRIICEKTIEPGLGLKYLGIENICLNLNGSFLLIQKVENADSLREIGLESISLSYKLDEIARSTQFWEKNQQPLLVSIHPFPKGVAYLTSVKVDRNHRSYQFQTYDFQGRSCGKYIIGTTDSICPRQITYSRGQWAIAGFTYNLSDTSLIWGSTTANAESHAHSEGIEFIIIDDSLMEKQRVSYSLSKIKQSLFNKMVRVIDGNQSINEFLTNGELDILIEDIVIDENGYTVIGEAFSIGEGITLLEVDMGIVEENEIVLSTYDFVLMRFSRDGTFQEIQLVEKPIINTLVEEYLYRLDGINTAIEFFEMGLFPYLNYHQTQVNYVGYQYLKSNLCHLNLADNYTGCDFNLDLRVSCSPYSAEQQKYIRKSGILRSIERFSQKADALYVKLYDKMEYLAHEFTQLNAMYPPDQDDIYNSYLPVDGGVLIYLYSETCRTLSYEIVEIH